MLEIRRSESYPDGSWTAEAYELSPCGYPCNDGIDLLCVQWEGCGPDQGDGLRMCSSGCPSMERYCVRSSRPGAVEFDTKTLYSSLDDCLDASSATAGAASDGR